MFVSSLLILCCILTVFPACAQQIPEWTYPLSPEIISNRNGYITLANKDVLLSSDYIPSDLVDLEVKSVVRDAQLRKDAAEALKNMFEAAKEDDCILYVKSAYRSYRTQNTMYYNRLEKNGGKDDGLVAFPGASDHQTGLGVDVLNYAWTRKKGMNRHFAEDKEAIWMAEHCHEYGFVVRYQEDKEDLTKIKFEPWHLRYVGPEVAEYMFEKHLCLEEFTLEQEAYVAEYEAQGVTLDELLRLRSLPKEIKVVDTAEDGEEDFSMFY